MHNFKDSEYGHSLDYEEVEHSVWTHFEGMRFLTKKEVQHALQLYHVSKWANYKIQLSNPTKLIVIYNDNSCAWRSKASYILASKQWEIRKLYEPHTFSNPSISQDRAKLSYLLINISIHTLIENNPSTSVSALISHIKRPLKTSMRTRNDRFTIYWDCCKLCNNFFLVWSWRRKHCQCHHKEIKQ